VGRHGDVIGLERFGASAPGKKALEELGFGAASVANRAKALVEKARKAEAALAGK
jgi:transketolase